MEARYSSFMVFALEVGSSRVSTTMPSPSWSNRTALSRAVSRVVPRAVSRAVSRVVEPFPRVVEPVETTFSPISDPLDHGRDPHAPTDAQGHEPVPEISSLELVDDGAEQHRARRAEGMPHRDRAAVDVDLLVRQVQLPHEPHRHRGEGLVDLVEVDVLDRQPRLRECLAGGRGGPGQHDRRVRTGHGGGPDASAGSEPQLLTDRLGADRDERRPVDDAGGVAGVVHVVDLVDPVVLLQRHRVEAALVADPSERRREAGQALHGRPGADELVPVQDSQPVHVRDRDHRPLEVPVRLRLGRPRLRLRRERVDVGPGVPLQGGDQVRSDALRDERGGQRGRRVHRPGTAVGAQRDPRHRLHAAGEDEVLEPGAYPRRGLVHRLQPRRAEPVQLDPGHGVGVAGGERRGLRDVAALVAQRAHHPEHHVVDPVRVQARVPLAHLVEQPDNEVDRLDLVQRAGALALPARGADGVVQDRLRGLRLLSHVAVPTGRSGGGSADCDTRAVSVNRKRHVTCVAHPTSRKQMSEPTDAAAELMTLDELTRRVGMSVRNVRFYTTKGLVPPPIRRGRSGYYTADHLARLELVRELQAHGFTLSAIERYVARIPDDATPETIALHRTLLAPWMAEMPETIGKRELVRRAGRPLSPEDLEALNALGIVFPTKQGKYEVAVAHLSVGVALLDLGLPLEAALAAQDIFTEHGRRIAEELTELFRTKVWPVYRDGGAGSEQLREVFERFKPVTIQAVVTAE